MTRRAYLLAAALLLTAGGTAGADDDVPGAVMVLATLRPGHPRLYLTEAGLQELRDRAARDEGLARELDTLRRAADQISEQPVSKFEIPDGLRLLATSRRVLDRV